MEIKVYKSEYTGEYFENKKDYLSHLKEQKKEIEKRQKEESLKEISKTLKHEPRLTSKNIEEFFEKAFKAINTLNGDNKDKLLYLGFDGLNFGDISNSHSSPIGFEQNFLRKEDKPLYYKGWNGNITIVFSENRNTGENRQKIENLVKYFPAINTGSGGYSGSNFKGIKGYVLQYNLRLYLSDFPLIEKMYFEYEKLLEQKEKIDVENQNKIENKILNDLFIKEKTKEALEYQEKINDLIVKKNKVNELIYEKSKEISNEIFSKNKFKKIERLNELKKLF